jgi:hypothetical protein
VCPHRGRVEEPLAPACLLCGGPLDDHLGVCSQCRRDRADKGQPIASRVCLACGVELPKQEGRGGSGPRFLCQDCRRRRRNDRERWRARREREQAVANYGGRCVACGEVELLFLTLDHIQGGGSAHRRAVGAGSQFYRKLRLDGYPLGYQVLCWNCNIRKGGALATEVDASAKSPGGSI